MPLLNYLDLPGRTPLPRPSMMTVMQRTQKFCNLRKPAQRFHLRRVICCCDSVPASLRSDPRPLFRRPEHRMPEHNAIVSGELGGFRPYLLMLARLQFNDALQAKLDASDVVQQTLLDAHKCFAQFRGGSSGEMAAWLRQILARNMSDELRKFRRGKRNITCEASLQIALHESSIRLERWLAIEEGNPARRAIANEDLVRLAAALLTLPDDQRRAVELHHLQACSSAEVAARMGKTETAIAGLLRRGLKKLRLQMHDSVNR
jgi:RNA polymerase sigma-70 factor, ECF subfamily